MSPSWQRDTAVLGQVRAKRVCGAHGARACMWRVWREARGEGGPTVAAMRHQVVAGWVVKAEEGVAPCGAADSTPHGMALGRSQRWHRQSQDRTRGGGAGVQGGAGGHPLLAWCLPGTPASPTPHSTLPPMPRTPAPPLGNPCGLVRARRHTPTPGAPGSGWPAPRGGQARPAARWRRQRVRARRGQTRRSSRAPRSRRGWTGPPRRGWPTRQCAAKVQGGVVVAAGAVEVSVEVGWGSSCACMPCLPSPRQAPSCMTMMNSPHPCAKAGGPGRAHAAHAVPDMRRAAVQD